MFGCKSILNPPLCAVSSSVTSSVALFLSFIDLPGQVVDGEAPDGPDAVVLTQSVLEGRGRLGGDRHLGDRGRGKDSGAGLNGGLLRTLSETCCRCRTNTAAVVLLGGRGYGGGVNTPNRTSEETTMQTRKKNLSQRNTRHEAYSISTHSDSGCPLFVT